MRRLIVAAPGISLYPNRGLHSTLEGWRALLSPAFKAPATPRRRQTVRHARFHGKPINPLLTMTIA
jgi:hypothetical protein